MLKYLVLGANGQLGQELIELLSVNNADYVALGSKELDITDRQHVLEVFDSEKPDVILDAAAYTAVDDAEDDGKSRNWSVNAYATKNLADATKAINAKLIFVSTDYVFDGTKDGAYLETDAVNPLNEYGKAKLAGECFIQESGVDFYIIRTSWVFGKFGRNFVYTMQRLGKKLDEISVISDQKGRPTWTYTLATFMLHLIKTNSECGVYNLSNEEETTWYEFASEILRNEDVEIKATTTDKFPTKARRPKNSVLDLSKAKGTGFHIPTWREALYEFEQTI